MSYIVKNAQIFELSFFLVKNHLSFFTDSVAVSELPGSKFRGRYRDIVTDISTLKSMDISDVVVLITMAEFRKFRVPSLLSEYETNGFLVFHFPIEDGMIPEDVLDLVELLSKIRKRIGKHCVQCFQKYDVSMDVCILLYEL